jgi:hypothetical protein
MAGSVERATIVIQNAALEDQQGGKDAGIASMREASKDRKAMEAALKRTQERMEELQAELERIGNEADDGWQKVKGFFGDDNGMADTTQAAGETGAEIERLNYELALCQEEMKDLMAGLQEQQDQINKDYDTAQGMLDEMNRTDEEALT